MDQNEERQIIGIDEAGRGALAGPVYAGCVLLPFDFDCSVLNDSKKMSAAQREKTRQLIMKKCIYGIGFATETEIDKINILQATFIAMQRAFENFVKMAENTGFVFNNSRIIIDGTKGKGLLLSSGCAMGENTKPENMRAMVEAAKKYGSYDRLCELQQI